VPTIRPSGRLRRRLTQALGGIMKILEIFWSWPTVVAAVIFLYHREL